MMASCARAASASGIRSPMTGLSVPFSSPAPSAAYVSRLSSGVDCHEGYAANVRLTCHRITRIDLDGAAVADHRNSSLLRQHRQILCQVLVSQQFDDHIHAATIGQLHQLVEIAFGGMVEHVMRALLLHQLHSRFAAGGADDRHSRGSRQLHGRRAYSSAGAVNQHGLRGLGFGAKQ